MRSVISLTTVILLTLVDSVVRHDLLFNNSLLTVFAFGQTGVGYFTGTAS